MEIIEMIVFACSILIGCFVFFVVYEFKYNSLKKEYIKTLDEHDKAVVLDYENALRVSFKPKKK